ncbi:MAG: nitroreductase family protein [Negativicutes bacterium]|nr:nitroreductase family protein [Negativicutes bacterium]
MTKDVFDAMRESHSVRSFKPQPVPEPTLSRILEAACWAPSAGNLQPWYFYVVVNPGLKEKIAFACYEQGQVADAPVVVVVLADPARSNDRYGERGAQLYCLQDTAAAAQNMLLAAVGLGLSTCWVGGFDEVMVQRLVEAPPRLRAVAIICLGYGDAEEQAHHKERYRVAEVAKILH